MNYICLFSHDTELAGIYQYETDVITDAVEVIKWYERVANEAVLEGQNKHIPAEPTKKAY